eukprot:300891_1
MQLPCKYYLASQQCKFGNHCIYPHLYAPSPWVLSNSSEQHFYDSHQISNGLYTFIGYFSHPNYIQLSAINVLQIYELFAQFNNCDWEVLLKDYYVRHKNNDKYKLNLALVCKHILEIIQFYKTEDNALMNNWNQLIHLLSREQLLSVLDITETCDTFSKQLFSIYTQYHAEADHKIPLLSYQYKYKQLLPNSTYTNVPYADKYKLILNPKFRRFCSLDKFTQMLLDFSDSFKLYCNAKDHRLHPQIRNNTCKKSNNMVEELILYYVWQDCYCQQVYDQIHELYIGFNKDLLGILCSYVIDERVQDMLEIRVRIYAYDLIKDKKRLKKYIAFIDRFTTNIETRKEKEFWKRYLLSHRCTTTLFNKII